MALTMNTSTTPSLARASASASALGGLGDFGPRRSPSPQSSVFWPGPMADGQVVCAAGLDNVNPGQPTREVVNVDFL